MKTNIQKLLALIREKPGMYIGRCSIIRLSAFIIGYNFATFKDEGVWPIDPMRQFYYMVRMRYPDHSDIGWDDILISVAGGEKAAWDLFWELWDDFLEHPSDYEAIYEQSRRC